MRNFVRAALCAAICAVPLAACVLFEGPSDYPPKDAGATGSGDATVDGAPGEDAAAEASNDDAASRADTSINDKDAGDAATDAPPDAPPVDARACLATGRPCQASSECCSGLCQGAQGICK